MKRKKIIIIDKNRKDLGKIYDVNEVSVSYYFEISQKDPTPAQIELEKSQFKYIKENEGEE